MILKYMNRAYSGPPFGGPGYALFAVRLGQFAKITNRNIPELFLFGHSLSSVAAGNFQ